MITRHRISGVHFERPVASLNFISKIQRGNRLLLSNSLVKTMYFGAATLVSINLYAYPQHYPQIYHVCRLWRRCAAARRVASLLLACGCVGFAYCWPVAFFVLAGHSEQAPSAPASFLSSSSLGKTQTSLVLPSFARAVLRPCRA